LDEEEESQQSSRAVIEISTVDLTAISLTKIWKKWSLCMANFKRKDAIYVKAGT
jgi:hypothetical protein